MLFLSTLLGAILDDMRHALARAAARDRAHADLLVALWTRIGRLSTRFERLYHRWRTGTLRPLPPPRATACRAPRPRRRFPTGRAWLCRITREANAHGSQLQYLFAAPDFRDFLAAVPRAARILRPLCPMFGIDPGDLPQALFPPPRRRDRPAAPPIAAPLRRACTTVPRPRRKFSNPPRRAGPCPNCSDLLTKFPAARPLPA